MSLIFLSYGFYLSVYNGFHINSYYTSEDSLAGQEKTIAQILIADRAPTFYTYDTTTLGSIMFYSGLIRPVEIDIGTKVPVGSYVLFPALKEAPLEATYPNEKLISLYEGATLELGKFSN